MFTGMRRLATNRRPAQKNPGQECGRGKMLASDPPGRPGNRTQYQHSKTIQSHQNCVDLHQFRGSSMNRAPGDVLGFGLVFSGRNGDSRHRLDPNEVVMYLFDAGDVLRCNNKCLAFTFVGDDAG